MKFYYDIDLSFNDSLINYYEWDHIDHVVRIPIFKVKDVSLFLINNCVFNTDYKYIILSDGIFVIACEVIDNNIVYVSSLKYKDEIKILKLVSDLELFEDYSINGEKSIVNCSKFDSIKNSLINTIKSNDKDFIKYLYYLITSDSSKNIKYMKEYLINDIDNYFSYNYLKIYNIIHNSDKI